MDLQARIDYLEKENALLRKKLDLVIRQLFGKKSERLDPAQLELLLSGLEDEPGKTEASPVPLELVEAKPKSVQRRERRVRLPEDLPVEEVVLDPEPVKACPGAWKRIGEEVSEELDYEPGRFLRRRTVRPKYVRLADREAAPLIAPLPPRLIEGGMGSPGLISQVIIGKYCDHLPLYRQEKIFAQRHQVLLPRQTMARWVEVAAGWLKPIYEHMGREMFAGGYVQADETPVKHLDPGRGKTAQGYLWAYRVPGGDTLFSWHGGRAHGCLQGVVPEDFRGTLQCDGYSAYQTFAGKRNGAIELVGCWAHARRKFHQALENKEAVQRTGWILRQIQHLYRIERELRESRAGPRFRAARRNADSRPILKRIHRALARYKASRHHLPKSYLGEAIDYALGHWEMLSGYLEHGHVEIDNNLVENAIRPIALGRKNWLFIGARKAGWRSAVLYSLIESCRNRGIDPAAYLKDVLTRLPAMTNWQVRDVTPKAWAEARQKLRKTAS